jgi:hypothetical protein
MNESTSCSKRELSTVDKLVQQYQITLYQLHTTENLRAPSKSRSSAEPHIDLTAAFR